MTPLELPTNPAKAWLDLASDFAYRESTAAYAKPSLGEVCVAELREAVKAEGVGAGLGPACKGTLGIWVRGLWGSSE